ncbi:MAG: flagellar basal-body MS-ring/collar protein FliF [Thiobacillaceae bacterium]
MSDTAQVALAPQLNKLFLPGGQQKIIALVAAAAVIALAIGVWMWGNKPDYKVLFSNVSDQDGGAIIGVLAQMNVPYKFTDGGGAILVPADQVHEARLRLASQGLPRGGTVGFELMENQKLGISQFLEQVNYQRALEGELARSIQTLSAVQSARVHIAFTKQSVFVRDQQKPTASVILNLYPGRTLDKAQVNAISHLVSSSVSDLPSGNVTILDQNGDLLSDSETKPDNGLDPDQLKYVQGYEQNLAQRIESILYPIVGKDNVRAEVTAEMDFTRAEQAAETYKPNQSPTDAVIRSQQTSESTNSAASPGGVPGALSNQPPAPATAPINAPKGASSQSTATANQNIHKESTTNYEVDKTIRYTQQPMGGVKRLSAAVVVNYRKVVGKNGKTSNVPLTAAEKAQIESLVKDAMGFNQSRGDTLSVANTPFTTPEVEKLPEQPFWKQPDNIDMAQSGVRYLIMALVIAYLYFKILRPLTKRIGPVLAGNGREGVNPSLTGPNGTLALPPGQAMISHEERLLTAKSMARQNPQAVANVVKNWVE